MHYNDIPLYPYHLDPLRIMVPRNSRPAEADPPSSGPAMTQEETTGDGPAPASPASAAAPSTDAAEASADLSSPRDEPVPAKAGLAAASAVDGEGEPPTKGRSDPDPDPAECHRLMRAWLDEHFDIVEAMARAGEAPVRPPPAPDPAAAEPPPPPPPVHVARGDRWNKKKMADFLRQLAATHSVTAAARSVGMSRESAHRLRNRLKGQPFDVAWEAAFRHGYDNLAHAALELALEGEEVPHYYHGELKGTHRRRIPQLMIGLLKLRNQAGAPMLGRYGAAAEYWGENWDTLLQRVETGAVDWSDERAALGEDEVNRLGVPDEERKLKLIELRNLPDEPSGRRP